MTLMCPQCRLSLSLRGPRPQLCPRCLVRRRAVVQLELGESLEQPPAPAPLPSSAGELAAGWRSVVR
jgi:hypothetical protein